MIFILNGCRGLIIHPAVVEHHGPPASDLAHLITVVYGIFSKKYRAVFLEHFCPKKPEQEEIQMSSVTTKNTDIKN